MNSEAVLAEVEAGLDASRERWFELLRIPSVSAQPTHGVDCAQAAAWVRDQLAGLGFEAAVHATAGHPVVLAHHAGPGPGAPHVLFYGHYDVQPAEPLELWTDSPFDPKLTDGPHGPRVVARGAVDDKGQVMTWLEALRAWHSTTGTLPVQVTVLVEGEEEVGSPNLEPFLAEHRAALAADVAIISDTGMWDIDTPALTTRLRGMVYTQLTLHAADRDLHSGIFGGAALNPINALTTILGGLQDDRGRIQLPGFYDGIPVISNALASEWEGLQFDEAAFLGGGWAVGARGRARGPCPAAALGAAHGGYQWYLGRLSGRRGQDRDRRACRRQDIVPPGARAGSGEYRRGVPRLHRGAAATRRAFRAGGVQHGTRC